MCVDALQQAESANHLEQKHVLQIVQAMEDAYNGKYADYREMQYPMDSTIASMEGDTTAAIVSGSAMPPVCRSSTCTFWLRTQAFVKH